MNQTRIQLSISAGLLVFGLLGVVIAQGVMGGGTVSGGTAGVGMMGSGMMNSYAPESRPISQDEARRRAQGFVGRYGTQVRIRDFMVFSENYYVQVIDAATGAGLAEVLVDRYSGQVRPEPGPDMLWNTRFGMQGGLYGGGMMGAGLTGTLPGQGLQTASVPGRYTLEAAQKLADTFVAGYLPGSKVLEGLPFPGYYTFDYGRKAVEGMLSVNAYTGEVWVHSWHGVYIGDLRSTPSNSVTSLPRRPGTTFRAAWSDSASVRQPSRDRPLRSTRASLHFCPAEPL